MFARLAAAVTAALLLLVACNDGCLDCGQRDLWGNVYPRECTAFDLADKVDIQVVLELPDETFPEGVLGLCVGCDRKNGVAGVLPAIWLNERLTKTEKPSAMRHEQCHRYEFLIGKPVNWHPTSPRRE